MGQPKGLATTVLGAPRTPSTGLVHVQGCPKNPYGEMRQMGSFIVELNPTDDAVVFQVLRDFRLVDPQMLSELGLQAAFRIAAAASVPFPAASSAKQVCETDSQGLARFDVVGRDLIGIREQKDARSRRCFIRLVNAV